MSADGEHGHLHVPASGCMQEESDGLVAPDQHAEVATDPVLPDAASVDTTPPGSGNHSPSSHDGSVDAPPPPSGGPSASSSPVPLDGDAEAVGPVVPPGSYNPADPAASYLKLHHTYHFDRVQEAYGTETATVVTQQLHSTPAPFRLAALPPSTTTTTTASAAPTNGAGHIDVASAAGVAPPPAVQSAQPAANSSRAEAASSSDETGAALDAGAGVGAGAGAGAEAVPGHRAQYQAPPAGVPREFMGQTPDLGDQDVPSCDNAAPFCCGTPNGRTRTVFRCRPNARRFPFASPHIHIAVFIIGLVLLFFAICTYCITAMSDPGYVAKRGAGPDTDREVETEKASLIERGELDDFTLCVECNVYRKPGTQHCFDCGVCVTDLDHHCPWTGKCIGKYNLAPFYVWLTFIQILCLYVYGIAVGYLVKVVFFD